MSPKALERLGVILAALGAAGLVVGCAALSIVLAIFVGSALLAFVGVLLIATAARSTPPKKGDQP